MKKTCLLLLLLVSASLFGSDRLQYSVIKNSYVFSTYFEMIGPEDYEGRVTKNSVSVRNFYKYYNAEGGYRGQGITRLASLGPLYKWGADIDIYDEHGKKAGVIYGKLWSTAKAKFEMYNERHDLVAIAYYGYNREGFSLMKSGKIESLIGYMKAAPNTNIEVVIYDREGIDERIIKIFSAFVSDFQKSF
jgi:hypothetical protein